jgi:hypothetical protein
MHMAKPKRNLIGLLRLLKDNPMVKGEIRAALNIKKRTEYNIVKEAEKKGWIEEDELKIYHLTLRGKSIIDIWRKPTDSTLFEVYSQVIDTIGLRPRSNRPTAKCTLIIKDADKIKELDKKTAAFYDRFLLDLPENATSIKAALARVIDSILDLKAKDMRLPTVLDSQHAESLSVFNVETNFPGYDSLKRYIALAKTNFKILIEFDGEKWVATQNFDDIEKYREDTLKFYKEPFENIRSQERRIRINKAIQDISFDTNTTRKELQHLRLFETKADLKEFVHKNFELYEKDNIYKKDSNNLKEIIQRAFATGLFEYDKKVLYHLKTNIKKLNEFHNSINS